MAKKPAKTNPSPRGPRRGAGVPESDPSEPVDETMSAPPAGAVEIEMTELDVLEAEYSVSPAVLDELENRLNARLAEAGAGEMSEAGAGASFEGPESGSVSPGRAAGDFEAGADDLEPPAAAPAPSARRARAAHAADSAAAPTGAVDDEAAAPASGAPGGRPRAGGRGFGPVEWAALGGFAAVALISAILFFKFLYAHPAPTQGGGLPDRFALPLAGSLVRLSGVDAGWRERVDGDKAQPEEVVLPMILLALDPAQASTGFVRVEFVDQDEKIRGDILTVAIEGGRFKDGGRGEVLEEGGLKLRLAGTVGFRTHALFSSYMAGEEPRWSVRVKEGGDYSNGPWTELGAALIPNTKH
jgi:hypothetical protein